MRNLPRPDSRAARRGETIATWRHGRRDGTTAELRATRTGDRVVIAERHGRRWTTTREAPADPKTIAKLRRQGRR